MGFFRVYVFFRLVVTLDIMDAAQEHQTNIAKSVKKNRIDSEGNILQGLYSILTNN